MPQSQRRYISRRRKLGAFHEMQAKVDKEMDGEMNEHSQWVDPAATQLLPKDCSCQGTANRRIT
ncbi:hypothetical protein HN51_021894 [Arachis hypogaea]